MSSKKHSQHTSNSVAKVPRYIKARELDGDLVQVSTRIPKQEKDRFEAAQKVLRARGFDMELSRVIRDALADAANYVEETYGSQTSDNSKLPKNDAGSVSEEGIDQTASPPDE